MAERQTRKQNLDLGLIGNCRVAALVDRNARIVWWCFPRFDGDPIFSRLLAGDEEKGFCDVVMADRDLPPAPTLTGEEVTWVAADGVGDLAHM